MEMIKQNVMTTHLTKEQTGLWLSTSRKVQTEVLSVQEATELLSLTVDQIRKSALNEKL